MQNSTYDTTREKGITHDEYVADWKTLLAGTVTAADKEARKQLHYIRYNLDRSTRVHEQFQPSPETIAFMEAIEEPQLWMVITENWCGDSAFILPGIVETARLSDKVDLRILYRDTYPEVMDRYLTNGGKAIPMLVVFDKDGKERFTFGPRTSGGVAEKDRLVAGGADKAAMVGGLVKWYEAGGWKEVESELIDRLKASFR